MSINDHHRVSPEGRALGASMASLANKAPLQQAVEPVARVAGVDEYGPRIDWFVHWAKLCGVNLYVTPLSVSNRTPPDAYGQSFVDIDQIASERYKVLPSHDSMFHRWAVVAGDGTQQLYLGSEAECQNMARKFAGAFLDGAYLARQTAVSYVAGIIEQGEKT
jgi:hypothetical protein